VCVSSHNSKSIPLHLPPSVRHPKRMARSMQWWTFRVFRFAFFALFSLDVLVDLDGAQWVRPTTVSVTKIPLLFEDYMRWATTLHSMKVFHAIAFNAGVLSAIVPDCAYTPLAIIAALSYNLAYWTSVLNRYQHKYLLCIMLWILPFAHRREGARKMLLAQLGIVYAWTAVTKVADGGVFLSGQILPFIMSDLRIHNCASYIASVMHVDDIVLWQTASWLVVITEIILAILLVRQKEGMKFAFVLGIFLHVSFELSGAFRIGFFSYYMILFFMLLIPHFSSDFFWGEKLR